MVAGKDLTSAAIAPGSTEYGQRQALADGLPSAPVGGAIPASARPANAPMGPSGTPLERLLRGRAKPADVPLTSGLSVGPGSTPMAQAAQVRTSTERLRLLAAQAKNPRLRAMARGALKRREASGDL